MPNVQARPVTKGMGAIVGTKPRVVIIGGGFAGLECAKSLADAPVEIVLIDRQNHHLFQPLLYQVATAGLAAPNIAWPIRSILRKQSNVQVLMAEVDGINWAERRVLHDQGATSFDWLVLATGMTHGWFGHDEWSRYAVGLKSLEDAQQIRSRLLTCFEEAEAATDENAKRMLLTSVVIGGGPTGVEMAGSMAELANRTLVEDFRRIDPRSARVVLIEAGPRLLNGFPEDLGEEARQRLEAMGVRVLTGTRVQDIRQNVVLTEEGPFHAGTIVWAAGVHGTPAAEWLGLEPDRLGRIQVDGRCRVIGRPGAFAIGDIARVVEIEPPLPGVAQVALQQGDYVADVIRAEALGRTPPEPFRYHDKGSMATIGRSAAVAVIGKRKFKGFIAWALWLFVHLISLFSFRNRAMVFMQWVIAYVNYSRGARLILRGVQEAPPVAEVPRTPISSPRDASSIR